LKTFSVYLKTAVKPVHFRRDKEQVLGGCEKRKGSRRLCEERGEGKVKREWKKLEVRAKGTHPSYLWILPCS
jgi:hypothetical protein